MMRPELSRLGNDIRRLVLRAVHHAGAGHIGGVLSAADMLAALYFSELHVDPKKPDWEDRDRFILSKGHCAIGLYAALALRGYFTVAELDTFDAVDSRLQGHPDMRKLPGLDMSTGSLGQGLSPGVGMALGARILHKDFHTWVMLGDGEIQEGQIWEAAFVAARYGLDNLTAILDGTICSSTAGQRKRATVSSLAAIPLMHRSRNGRPSAGARWNATVMTPPISWLRAPRRA